VNASTLLDGIVEFLRGPTEPNVGGPDRVWRALVGPLATAATAAALLGWLDIGSGVAAEALVAVGLFVGAVVTHSAATRRCRVNHLTGVDTSD
jgi:hypothetical protein